MMDSLRFVSELMDGIAAETNKQTRGIGQIIAAMGEIEKAGAYCQLVKSTSFSGVKGRDAADFV